MRFIFHHFDKKEKFLGNCLKFSWKEIGTINRGNACRRYYKFQFKEIVKADQ